MQTCRPNRLDDVKRRRVPVFVVEFCAEVVLGRRRRRIPPEQPVAAFRIGAKDQEALPSVESRREAAYGTVVTIVDDDAKCTRIGFAKRDAHRRLAGRETRYLAAAGLVPVLPVVACLYANVPLERRLLGFERNRQDTDSSSATVEEPRLFVRILRRLRQSIDAQAHHVFGRSSIRADDGGTLQV